jgi:hypothetical protein
MPYILGQVYSRFYTLIPAGFLDGLGAGPLWCAKCIYLNVVAEVYSKITGVSVETVLARFFGIFFMIYELSEVWGNLISSAGTRISRRVTHNVYHGSSVSKVMSCKLNGLILVVMET